MACLVGGCKDRAKLLAASVATSSARDHLVTMKVCSLGRSTRQLDERYSSSAISLYLFAATTIAGRHDRGSVSSILQFRSESNKHTPF